MLYCSRDVMRLSSLWNRENSFGRPMEGWRLEEEEDREGCPTEVFGRGVSGRGRVSDGLTIREKIISRASGLFATSCSKTA